jgi:hypothetical protein
VDGAQTRVQRAVLSRCSSEQLRWWCGNVHARGVIVWSTQGECLRYLLFGESY